MKTGDAFSAMLSPTEPKRHFWVVVLAVLSSDEAVCCNITSFCPDKTTAIHDAEYPLLTQPTSYMNYPQICIQPVSSLEEKIKKGLARKCPPVSADLRKQIQQGAILSKYTPNYIKAFLRLHIKQH